MQIVDNIQGLPTYGAGRTQYTDTLYHHLHRQRQQDQQHLCKRPHHNHGIKSIQNATMTGNQISVILNIGLPLDYTEAEVAKYTSTSTQQAIHKRKEII